MSAAESEAQGSRSMLNMSASEFVRDGVSERTLRYFYIRKVLVTSISVGVVRLPAAYMDATALVYFSDDTFIDRPLCSSPHLQPIIADLHEVYQGFLKDGPNRFIGPARVKVQNVVQSNICSIIHAVYHARVVRSATQKTMQKTMGSITHEEVTDAQNETTYRDVWDQLISCAVSGCLEPDVFYDRDATLRYSENPCIFALSQHLATPDAPHATQAALDITEECADVFNAVYPEAPDTDSYRSSANEAWNAAHTAVRDQIERQSRDEFDAEPIEGVAHGFLSLSIPDVYNSPDVAEEVAIFLPDPAGASAADAPIADPTKLGCPMECTQHAPAARGPRSLNMGLLSVQHTECPQQLEADYAATVHNRLHLAAMLTFMRLFGIGNFPVFGIITSGALGVMSCAWSGTVKAVRANGETYHPEAKFIADQHGTLLDICDPLDAVNVVTFVAFVVFEQARDMRALFKLTEEQLLNMQICSTWRQLLERALLVPRAERAP